MKTNEDQKIIKELEARNAFIETILQNLPIGIAVNKIDDGKVTVINKHFCEIYGWPAEDLADVPGFFRKVYPDAAYRNEIMLKVMNDIQSGNEERMSWNGVTVTTQTGEKRIVNSKNIPLYDQNLMISTAVDVTNEFNQAAEIKWTKANQEALINATQDLLWSVDSKLNIITANHSFLEAIKMITGKPIKEGDYVLVEEFGKEQLEKWTSYYQRAFKGEQFTVKDQHYNTNKQSIEYSMISLNPMFNDENIICGVACYSKDITILKQNELRIIQQNERLTEIALINAHDIRRPVATILGLVQLFNKDTIEEESNKDLLKHLETATQELDTVIRRIINKTID